MTSSTIGYRRSFRRAKKKYCDSAFDRQLLETKAIKEIKDLIFFNNFHIFPCSEAAVNIYLQSK